VPLRAEEAAGDRCPGCDRLLTCAVCGLIRNVCEQVWGKSHHEFTLKRAHRTPNADASVPNGGVP
jgi:hypothetical protein